MRKHVRQRPRRACEPRRFTLESLDGRVVPSDLLHSAFAAGGFLNIVGTDAADVISVGTDPGTGKLSVDVNGETSEWDAGSLHGLRIFAKGGDDLVTISDEVLLNALVRGGDGNDTLDGGGGNDSLMGGGGNDLLDGGAGDDKERGGPGDDVLNGDAGNDVLDGGAGNDIENGGDGNDSCRGGAGDDTVDGGAGDDKLDGGAGDDQLEGGDGDDQEHGGAGDDSIDGGSGDDSLDGGAGNDTESGDNGDDAMHGGDGNDSLDGGAGDDEMHGDAANDSLAGGDGDDKLDGGAGDDDCHGDGGDDAMHGGGGDDHLDGGDGNNLLDGDRGHDTEEHGDVVDLNAAFGARLTGSSESSGWSLALGHENADGSTQTWFAVKVEHAAPGVYDVSVDGATVGQLTVNDAGFGGLWLANNPQEGITTLPTGFPQVHAGSQLRVSSGDSVLLEGSFVALNAHFGDR